MFKSLIISFALFSVALSSNIFAQNNLTDDRLAHEGRRIGTAYHLAVKSGDIDMQNDALNQFNEILVTLRKQAQADILTKAFNNANIHLINPEKDALLYSRALMNARAKGDSIAIEDATDIAKSVKEFYIAERTPDDADRYYDLYNLAVNGAELGNKYSNETDAMARMDILSEAGEIRSTIANDDIATKVFNDSFDYYSIKLTSPTEDAKYYSEEMKKAINSGEQSQIDIVARIIGMVYERYSFDRTADEAQQFNTLVNE